MKRTWDIKANVAPRCELEPWSFWRIVLTVYSACRRTQTTEVCLLRLLRKSEFLRFTRNYMKLFIMRLQQLTHYWETMKSLYGFFRHGRNQQQCTWTEMWKTICSRLYWPSMYLGWKHIEIPPLTASIHNQNGYLVSHVMKFGKPLRV